LGKIKLGFISCLIGITFSGCLTPSTVDAGEEAVLVDKPYFFGHGGVQKTPVTTGQTWTWFSTQVIRLNVKPYNIDIKFDDLITADNNPVDFHVHLLVQHIAGKTPILVEKFGGKHWYENNVKEPFRAFVRHYTKQHTMFEMTTDASVTDKMEVYLMDQVKSLLKTKNIPVDVLKVTVGKVTPPEAVISATIETAVQKQNVLTQMERIKAEEARQKTEVASANADKAYAETFGMTPAEYLRNKKLENDMKAIDKAESVNVIIGNIQPVKDIK